MKNRIYIIFLYLTLLLSLVSSFHLKAQTLKAVNDTVDLYPGISKTVFLLGNDTIPYGDSLKITGGNATGNLITTTPVFKGFYNYLVTPIWGFNGNLSGYYTIIDYTLNKSSSANILFRIHDHSYDSLDINNVKAAITAYGNEFYLFGTGSNLFRIPKDSQKGTLFNFSLWIGGKGNDSTLYLAAENYRQGPTVGLAGKCPDFYAGPVMDSVNYSIYQDTVWSRTWKVRKSEIEYHKSHWNSPGYKVPVNILTWLGNGNKALGQAAQLAPYYDRNGDHSYDPADGDYPLIRGDEAFFVIFNDDRDIHKESGGMKMGVEIHLMAYAFDMPDDSAFKNTIFFNYKIYNRSSRTYFNTFIGTFAELDIGYNLDDYIGCDVERSSIIGFNGLPSDGSGQGNTYGAHPPAQSVTILGGPYMDPSGHDRPRLDNTGHKLCNESINGTGFGDSISDNERYGLTNFMSIYPFVFNSYNFYPMTAKEFYHYMQSIWLDSTHLFYGGMGHAGYGGYGPDCMFMYPGESDSLNWGSGCQLPNGPVNWTAKIAGVPPDEVKGVGATGPFTFKPGDVQEVDIAFVFARDYTGQDTLEPSVEKLRQMIDIVRNSYNTGKLPNGNSFFGINDPTNHSSSEMKIFPNPSYDVINILFNRPVNGNVKIRIINTSGMEVYSSNVFSSGKNLQLDVSGLLSGIYFIIVQTRDFTANGKAIIIK